MLLKAGIISTIKENSYMNIGGSVTAIVMQEIEGIVLECMYNYAKCRLQTGIISLCADGMMIEKSKFYDHLLIELQNEVFIKTGFVISLVEKKFKQIIQDVTSHVKPDFVFTPNTNFKYIDRIVNRFNVLIEAFQHNKYFHESMTFIRQEGNDVILKCSSEKCLLCKCQHIESECSLTITDKYDFILHCHKRKAIFKKGDKGLSLVRNMQMDKISEDIQQFFTLDTMGIKNMIVEDSRFIGCNEENEIVYKDEYNEKFLILMGQCGKGKTSFIQSVIGMKENKRILFVSQRKTFTNFIKNYQERALWARDWTTPGLLPR